MVAQFIEALHHETEVYGFSSR